jgi:hypothetical protein
MIAWFVACSPESGIRLLVPVMGVAPEEVAFGDAVVPLETVRDVFVTNGGKAVLTVTAALEGDPVFALDAASFEIEADDSATVRVGFLPDTYLPYAGTLVLSSNDAERAEVRVPLTGTGVYAPMPDIDLDPTLDFGVVDVGDERSELLQVRNVGSADLHVATVAQTGSGAFTVLGAETAFVVGPGESQLLGVVYAPTGGQGDHAELTIASDDPDEPAVTVLVLGNGGGDLEYPVAVIDCPPSVAPPGFADLDGIESFDPTGLAIAQWIWTLTGWPADSGGYLTQNVTPATQLWADLAGDYTVSLTVVNEEGLPSAPATCTMPGVPLDDLHVELTWDSTTTDVDLHVAIDGGSLFEEPEDCYFCNARPEWGPGGLEDDARLDLDALGNGGPENINVEAPAAGTYVVRVHYFSDSATRPPAAAHVRVWLDGALAFDGTQALEYNDVWEVGQVNWPDATFGVYPVSLGKADRSDVDCD